MKDEIVNFRTALLAYNKGFHDKISCINGKNYYNYKGELNGDSSEELKDYLNAKKEDRNPDDFYLSIPAPTQSLLQRWIREKHKIHIDVSYLDNIYNFYYKITKMESNFEYEVSKSFQTYEKALEEGLKAALKMI